MVESPEEILEAENEKTAVIVQQWHQHKAVAMGDESQEEWLIAPNAYKLDTMR